MHSNPRDPSDDPTLFASFPHTGSSSTLHSSELDAFSSTTPVPLQTSTSSTVPLSSSRTFSAKHSAASCLGRSSSGAQQNAPFVPRPFSEIANDKKVVNLSTLRDRRKVEGNFFRLSSSGKDEAEDDETHQIDEHHENAEAGTKPRKFSALLKHASSCQDFFKIVPGTSTSLMKDVDSFGNLAGSGEGRDLWSLGAEKEAEGGSGNCGQANPLSAEVGNGRGGGRMTFGGWETPKGGENGNASEKPC